LTVGFFEMDSSTKGLGQEYNAETGSSERYYLFSKVTAQATRLSVRMRRLKEFLYDEKSQTKFF